MDIENHKYATALWTDKKIMMMVETYPTIETLEIGYRDYLATAKQKGLTKPWPIELLDETGKCRIVEELILDK